MRFSVFDPAAVSSAVEAPDGIHARRLLAGPIKSNQCAFAVDGVLPFGRLLV
jgi:hypothetical protein